MLPLILKDFTVIKSSYKSILLLSLIPAVVFFIQGMPHMAIIMLPLPFLYLPISYMFNADEKNNTHRLLVTFPIRKEYIVYSRYASVGLLFILIVFIQLLLSALFTKFAPHIAPAGSPVYSFSALFSLINNTLIPIAIFISIYLPIVFRFGYMKAASAIKFIFIGYFALYSALMTYISKAKPDTSIQIIKKAMVFVQNASPIIILILALALSIIICGISMLISKKLFNKRSLF